MPDNPKIKVLIVENEPVIALDIKLSLTQPGYEIAGIASNYRDALEIAHMEKPDIALMDIHIDGNKDGIQAAQALRTHYHIPVIFLTSLSEMDTIRKAMQSEPFGYLIKPFRKDELQSSIEVALFNHQKNKGLIENVNRYSSAVSALGSALIILSAEGIIEHYNTRAEELTGWGKDDKNNLSINLFLVLNDQPAFEFLENQSQAMDQHRAIAIGEHSYVLDKDNQRISITGQASFYHTAEGGIGGYIIAFAPVSGEKSKTPDSGGEIPGGQIINDSVFLRDKSSFYRILLEDISHVEALGNYVRVHTPKKIYTVLISLKEMENLLPQENFFRVHRSFIVALKHITAIHPIELQAGQAIIPIGKTFKEELLKKIRII